MLAALVFWAAAVSRAPAARLSRPQRMLAASMAAFALAFTLDIPNAGSALDGAAGKVQLANLVEHLLGVVGVALLRRWTTSPPPTADCPKSPASGR